MIKAEWLAAGAFLTPVSTGLVTGQVIHAGAELANLFSQWEAHTISTREGFPNYRKKYKNI